MGNMYSYSGIFIGVPGSRMHDDQFTSIQWQFTAHTGCVTPLDIDRVHQEIHI